jgi:hypothetical protein
VSAPVGARFAAQLLTGPPARDPLGVVARLLAVQAQDGRGARLAVRSRSVGLTAADVDRALTEDRSLVVTWLNRGTLHLVRSEDYWWLQALTAPTILNTNARRLSDEGVSADQAERAVDVIAKSLGGAGPLTRAQLGERLARAGLPTKGQALIHELLLASLRGLIVRGPMVGREQAFVLVRDWLDEPESVDRDMALAELARRFLAGHAPADERDLARWAGLPLRDARAGFRAIAAELRVDAEGLADVGARRRSTKVPPPRLLGAFDPVLFGWCSRDPILGPTTGIVTVNGIFRPFALVDGRAAATWTCPDSTVLIEPFEPLADADLTRLERDAVDVIRYLGRPASGPAMTVVT